MVNVLYIIGGITAFVAILAIVGFITSIFNRKDKEISLIAIRDCSKFVFIMIVLAFVCLYIYPTPYQYVHHGQNNILIKINRLTGETYKLSTTENAWIRLDGNK